MPESQSLPPLGYVEWVSHTIRVLIVDDEALIRHALRHVIIEAHDIDVMGEAPDGQIALAKARALRPDVILMDIRMPVMDGIEATRAITQEMPGTRVVTVTTFSDVRHVVPSLRAGASGYLLKDSEPDEFIATIRSVHAGEHVLAPRIHRALVEMARDGDDPEPLSPRHHVQALSPREADIARLICDGLTNREIARRLELSETTVKTYLRRAMDKWEVHDRTQVVITAVRSGLVRLS